ncbi:MAG: histidine triad nucleotide-binding protein [Candidatus Fimivivens sp.]
MDCLFCKIVAGEIPSATVYEDDRVLAFRDIDPKAPFHAVVIPKVHLASAVDINADNSAVIAHLFEVIAQIAQREKLDKGFRVVNNCGEEGGQTVGHLHFHLLAGRNLGWPPG